MLAHVVEKIANDGTMMVRDATNGDLRQMRLGIAESGNGLWLVAIGDP
jgi:hypothetical protein